MKRLALTLILTTGWAVAGIYYKAETTTVGDQKAQNSEMVVEAWVEGPKARIEIVESDNPMAGQGSYIVTKDGGKNLFLVNPKDKTYMEWNMDQLLQMAGAMMEAMGGIVNFTFENVKTEKLAQGSGDNMFGHETDYYKYQTSYDLQIKVMGMRRQQSVESIQEMWVTDNLRDLGLGIWLRNEPPSTGNEELDHMIREQMKLVKGFPLRSKTVSTTRQWNKKRTKVRKQTTATTITEVKEMREVAFKAGMAEVPAGYERVEMAGSNEGGNPFQGIFNRKKN